MSFERKIKEVKCHFHLIISTWFMTIDVDFEHLAIVVFVGFFSFSYTTLQKETTMCSPHLESGELHSPTWGQSIYWNYFEFFCMRDLFLLWHLFTQLFISAWTHWYLSDTLGYNPILHYLFCHPHWDSSGTGSSFIWPLWPFHILL